MRHEQNRCVSESHGQLSLPLYILLDTYGKTERNSVKVPAVAGVDDGCGSVVLDELGCAEWVVVDWSGCESAMAANGAG